MTSREKGKKSKKEIIQKEEKKSFEVTGGKG